MKKTNYIKGTEIITSLDIYESLTQEKALKLVQRAMIANELNSPSQYSYASCTAKN